MKKLAAVALVALSLSGCASVQRTASYGDGNLTADAQVAVQGKRMNVSVHPSDNSLLVQTTIADAAGSGALAGLTFGLVRGFRPDPWAVEAALREFVRPLGCEITVVRQIGAEQVTFEGDYRCPAGVDLRATVRAQTARLMRGEAIQP
jgi:hypothetical protein